MSLELKKNARCALYARVSTQKQDEETQRHTAKKFANDHSLTIMREYIDKQSAYKSNILQRKQLLQLLSDATEEKYDYILIFDRSRLARNALEHAELRTIFNMLGIPVIMCSTGSFYDASDKFGDLIKDATTRLEVATTVFRTRERHEDATKDGMLMGGIPPYGYKSAGQKRYELDPLESVLVKKVFDLYKRGVGFDQIARLMPLKSHRNKDWKDHHVKSIVTNPVYLGKTSMHIRKKKARATPNDKESWIVGDSDNIPKLISERDWNYCYELYQQRRNGLLNPKEFTTPYLLSTLAYCKKHGLPLKPRDYRNQSTKGKIYGEQLYRCEFKGEDGEECDLKVNIKAIHKHVLYYVYNKMLVDGFYGSSEKIHTELVQRNEEEQVVLLEDINRLKEENVKINTKMYHVEEELKIFDAEKIESDNLQKNLFEILQRYRLHLIQQSKINYQIINELQKKINFIKYVLSNFELWDEMFKKFFGEIEGDGNEERRLLLFLIKRIDVEKDPDDNNKCLYHIEAKVNLRVDHYLDIIIDPKPEDYFGFEEFELKRPKSAHRD